MDNERPIERLLRAFAKKRRDGAGEPLELHPATRRMLQGEVARQFPKKTADGATWAQVLAGLWPRLAWVAPVIVVLGIGVWALVQSHRKAEEKFALAKNLPAPTAQPSVMLERPAQRKLAEAETAEATARDKSLKALVAVKESPDFKKTSEPEVALVRRGEAANASNEALQIASQKKEARADTGGTSIAARDVAGEPRRELALDQMKEAMPKSSSVPVVIAGGQNQAGNVAAVSPPANRADLPSGGFGAGGGGGRGGRGARGARGGGATPALAAAAPVTPAPGPPAGTTATLAATSKSEAVNGLAFVNTVTLTQRFSQAETRARSALADSSVAPGQVLAAFQFEQNGSQLRVIDNDGSAYTGSIELAAADSYFFGGAGEKDAVKLKAEDRAVARQVAASPTPGSQTGQNFSFHVTGTNRTLNQQVVFTGNLLALTNAPLAAPAAATAGVLQSNQLFRAQQTQRSLQNSSISGKAQLGDGRQIEVNAVPIAPRP